MWKSILYGVVLAFMLALVLALRWIWDEHGCTVLAETDFGRLHICPDTKGDP